MMKTFKNNNHKRKEKKDHIITQFTSVGPI